MVYFTKRKTFKNKLHSFQAMVRRVFGATIGTLDDRIQDTSYGDVALLEDFLRPIWPRSNNYLKKAKMLFLKAISRYDYRNQETNRSKIRDELVRRINNGTASMDLFPYLEEKARKAKNHSLGWGTRSGMEPYIEKKDGMYQYGLNVFSLYKELIDKAETKESIAYLLQAIESRLKVRDGEAFRTDPKVHHGWRVEHVTEDYYGPSYGMCGTCTNAYRYEIFDQASFYKAYMPFAEAAKEKLSTILSLADDKTTIKIHVAIARLDEELKIPIEFHKQLYSTEPS